MGAVREILVAVNPEPTSKPKAYKRMEAPWVSMCHKTEFRALGF